MKSFKGEQPPKAVLQKWVSVEIAVLYFFESFCEESLKGKYEGVQF